MCNYVAYYRVSTVKQGASGLGIEASNPPSPRSSPARARTLGSRLIHGSRVWQARRSRRTDAGDGTCPPDWRHAPDCEIGQVEPRRPLPAWLAKGRRPIRPADMPEANEMVVGLMAVIAQAERKMISQRTQAALAEARKRVAVTGQKKHPDVKRLGNPRGASIFASSATDSL